MESGYKISLPPCYLKNSSKAAVYYPNCREAQNKLIKYQLFRNHYMLSVI